MKGAKEVIKMRPIKYDKKLLWCQDKRTGKTLLHVTAEAGHVKQLVQFMVDNGMTDAALLGDRDGDTALYLALQCEDLTEARYLIKAAPRTVYQVNHKGISPLYLATKLGRQDLVMYMLQMVRQSLLPACALERVQHPKNAALAHLAIKARDLVTRKTLMEHLPDLIKARNEKGWRPLSYASNKGYLDEVTYLLINFLESAKKHDKYGYLPIHEAVGGGHVSIIKAFYKHCPQTWHPIDRKGRKGRW
ncbi:hypothetical protein RND81_11G016400 [Saponaria officinalis]|uniref:Uncharacterized protein n=1 Tax=Saponaria officinalis TaxID=3572 RepID=A0AAW1HH32_SAPOF